MKTHKTLRMLSCEFITATDFVGYFLFLESILFIRECYTFSATTM
ncbi:hypothetical protein LEP1GSC175_3376 [Leptospira santarosai str. HAI821]|nr:hypothetical protein LEP1GSC175_3376 [Leptospira santarosai str. HAI821]